MSDWGPFMRGFNTGPSMAELVMWGITRREERHARIAAEEKAETAATETEEEQRKRQEALLSLFLPEPVGFEQGEQLGTTYPDIGISTLPGEAPPSQEKRKAPPGGWFPGQGPSEPRGEDIYGEGAPIYGEGTKEPTAAFLRGMEQVQEGNIDLGDLIYTMNMTGVDMYEPEPEEEVPAEFSQQGFDLVASMFANSFPHIPERDTFPEEFRDEYDMVNQMPAQTIMDLYKKPGEDTGRQPAGIMGGQAIIWNPVTEQYEFQAVPQLPEEPDAPNWRVAGDYLYDPARGPESLTPMPNIPGVGDGEFSDPVWDQDTGKFWVKNLETNEWKPQIDMPDSEAGSTIPGPETQAKLLAVVQEMTDAGNTLEEILSTLGQAVEAGEITQGQADWLKMILEQVTL